MDIDYKEYTNKIKDKSQDLAFKVIRKAEEALIGYRKEIIQSYNEIVNRLEKNNSEIDLCNARELVNKARQETKVLEEEIEHLEKLYATKQEELRIKQEINDIQLANDNRYARFTDYMNRLGLKTHKCISLINLYKQNTGLIIDTNSNVSFSFFCISKERPQTEHLVVLGVDEIYSLVHCSPSLTNIEELVEDLNATDDLLNFVARVRASFAEFYNS